VCALPKLREMRTRIHFARSALECDASSHRFLIGSPDNLIRAM
jgi:hypothetical protein